MTSRISILTCTSCGTEQRVKIEGDLYSACYACGGRDFASWPTLELPALVFDFTEVPTERLVEFMWAVFGEYRGEDE